MVLQRMQLSLTTKVNSALQTSLEQPTLAKNGCTVHSTIRASFFVVAHRYPSTAVPSCSRSEQLVSSPNRQRRGQKESPHPVVHVTTRLALSPSCAVELIKGLNAILTAVTQAKAQAERDLLPDKAVM
jgi:hypothetical protein